MKSDEELTWTTESKKELFKTPVFTVTSRHNKSVSGIVGDYIVNECPDWVIVIAEKDDNFLMVKQYATEKKNSALNFLAVLLTQVKTRNRQQPVNSLKKLEQQHRALFT